jgi:hypothetical protein
VAGGVLVVVVEVVVEVVVVDVSPDSSLPPHATANGVNTTAAPIAATVVQRRYSVVMAALLPGESLLKPPWDHGGEGLARSAQARSPPGIATSVTLVNGHYRIPVKHERQVTQTPQIQSDL